MNAFREIFSDAQGVLSFTRVMGATIIAWCLLNYLISTIINGELPAWDQASPLVTLVGIALTGKALQKPFEKGARNETP